MNLSDLRNIVIAQSLEESDTGGRLVTDDEKRLAESAAGAPLPQDTSKAKQNEFLGRRASNLIGTVEPRINGDRIWLRSSPFRSKFSLFVLITAVVAALVGYLTNELGPQKKINLLSFPLIGIVVWNLLVYLGELFIMFRKDGASTGIAGVITRALFPPPINLQKSDNESSLEFRARSLFQSRWRQINIPPLSARVKSTLHFTALLLAAAAIFGMYIKGLSKQYNAVWESTFFENGEQLSPFINVVLGPAQKVLEATKVLEDKLPTADDLDNYKEPAEGDSAKRWIHWYAATMAIFVILPRFLLGIFWHLKAGAMSRKLPFRELAPTYYERVLAVSTGDSMGIAVVPYAHKPGDNVIQGMRTYMEQTFKRPVSISWQDDISFGDEDDAKVEFPKNLQPMLLFNFGSTPEKETHLALYHRLCETVPEGTPAYQVILDCEAFDRKSESFNDADERRSTRFSAWKKLFAAENCEIHVISDHEIVVKEEQNG